MAQQPLRLIVRNLNFETSAETVGHLFERFGPVKNAEIATDFGGQHSRGYGFVDMSTYADSLRALKELNGAELDGRRIRITVDRSSDPHQTSGFSAPSVTQQPFHRNLESNRSSPRDTQHRQRQRKRNRRGNRATTHEDPADVNYPMRSAPVPAFEPTFAAPYPGLRGRGRGRGLDRGRSRGRGRGVGSSRGNFAGMPQSLPYSPSFRQPWHPWMVPQQMMFNPFFMPMPGMRQSFGPHRPINRRPAPPVRQIQKPTNGTASTPADTNTVPTDAPATIAASSSGAPSGNLRRGRRTPPPIDDSAHSETVVRVANLPFSLQKAELEKLFSDYKVHDIFLPPGNMYRSNAGWALVELESHAEQERVLQKPELTINGRTCTVKAAIKPPTNSAPAAPPAQPQATE